MAVRGAGLGGPLGAALNSVKAVSGSAYRVTIPAVLHIACLRQMLQPPSDTAEMVKNTPPDHRQPFSASLLCRAPPPSRGVMLPNDNFEELWATLSWLIRHRWALWASA